MRAGSSAQSYQHLSGMKITLPKKQNIQKQAQQMQHTPQQSAMSDMLEWRNTVDSSKKHSSG